MAYRTGGEAGIRTLGGVAPTTIFETVPFNRSGTSPCFDRNNHIEYHIHYIGVKPVTNKGNSLKGMHQLCYSVPRMVCFIAVEDSGTLS